MFLDVVFRDDYRLECGLFCRLLDNSGNCFPTQEKVGITAYLIGKCYKSIPHNQNDVEMLILQKSNFRTITFPQEDADCHTKIKIINTKNIKKAVKTIH